ncbi:MAG: hypothetical protein AAB795_01750 [Patescibacteria group bacterium]
MDYRRIFGKTTGKYQPSWNLEDKENIILLDEQKARQGISKLSQY